MDKQLIVSIGREFGSGGHETAGLLAGYYDIPLIDESFLHDLAEENNIPYEDIKKYDEKPRNMLFSKTVAGFTNAIEENVARLQFDYLKRMADNGRSFVIVGRCSEYVLRDYPCMVSAFILGDFEIKRERIMKKYNLSAEEAGKVIKKKDWIRRNYHNYFCKGKWGDSRSYDMCINSSLIGIKGTADVIKSYIGQRGLH